MDAKPRHGALHPAWLALAVGLVPIVAVHAAFFISLAEGRIDTCIPYFEGCTSISRAARHGLANHVFKGLMLPTAAGILMFWMCAHAWLKGLHASPRKRLSWMTALGMIGALFLILYATFLGVEGDIYQWMRRYGVTIYFSFTVVAQMLLASLLPAPGPHAALRLRMTCVCSVMLALGLASVPLQHLLGDRKATVNAIEWWYALLMTSTFVLVGLDWRRNGLRLRLIKSA